MCSKELGSEVRKIFTLCLVHEHIRPSAQHHLVILQPDGAAIPSQQLHVVMVLLSFQSHGAWSWQNNTSYRALDRLSMNSFGMF